MIYPWLSDLSGDIVFQISDTCNCDQLSSLYYLKCLLFRMKSSPGVYIPSRDRNYGFSGSGELKYLLLHFPWCFSAYYMITLIRIMLLILVIPVLICCWTFDILKLINSLFQDLEVRPLRVENLLYRWVFKEFIENNDDKDGENDLLFLSLVQRLA